MGIKGARLPLGFTFSFPCKQTSLDAVSSGVSFESAVVLMLGLISLPSYHLRDTYREVVQGEGSCSDPDQYSCSYK